MEQVNSDIVLNVYTLVGIVLTSVLVGGVSVFTVIGAVARSILGSEAGLKAIETLAESVPPKFAEGLLLLVDNAAPVIELIEEAFNGVPASEKANTDTDDIVTTLG